MMNKLYALIIAFGLTAVVSACDNKSPAENAAESIGQAVEQVQENVEQVVEQVGENLDAAATDTTEVMEEAKESIESNAK